MYNSTPPQLITYRNFVSNFVPARNIDILLPPDYSEYQAYPVMYIHDGQNLFDPSLSYTGVHWGISETVTALVEQDHIVPPIIVGIWNNSDRISEYMPNKAYKLLNSYGKQKFNYDMKARVSVDISPISSDNYLKFIVRELKPFIDRNFNTLTDFSNTFMMGSSMGGLISLYAVCEYPDVFGGAACLSTHWTAGDGIMLKYLERNLDLYPNHKLYFDFGTETTDAEYEPFQVEVDELIESLGYSFGDNWITQKFFGEDHSESAWQRRVHIPLTFLLS